MRRFAGRFLLALSILSLASGLNIAQDAPSNPPWCKPGYTCVETKWLSERVAEVWLLRADNARLKAKVRRLGCVAGIGGGLSAVVTEEWEINTAPAGHIGVTCGWRF